MQYNRMKLTVGIFVAILFITIFTSLYYLLEEKGTFDKRYSYHFSTDSAASFNVGMALKFSGFTVGVIDEIALKDDGTVFMTFSVSEENRKWIADGSVLMIKKPLIGSPHIEVFSAIGNEILDEGSTLVILKSDDINDMISKLEPAVNKIINIINSVDKISSNFSRNDSDFMKSIKNIENISHNLATSDSLLTTVTGDANSTKNLIKTLNSTTQIMNEIYEISKHVNKITSSLDSDIVSPASSTIKELNLIMIDVKQKLEAIDATVKAIGSYDSTLLELKEQIVVAISKSNQIMDKVDAMMQDEQKTEVVLP